MKNKKKKYFSSSAAHTFTCFAATLEEDNGIGSSVFFAFQPIIK